METRLECGDRAAGNVMAALYETRFGDDGDGLDKSQARRSTASETAAYKKLSIMLGVTSVGLAILCIALIVGLVRADRRADENSNAAGSMTPAPAPEALYAWIPLHHQETDYTCGPSSMLSVYRAYGLQGFTEETLANDMRTTSEDGTNSSWMANDAWSRGFFTSASTNLTVAYLREQLATYRRLTVVGYQAWKWPNQTYPTDWDDGHYSVVVGYNATGIFLMDPWMTPGFYGYVENERFPLMWHFYDLAPVYGWGMTLWMPNRALAFTATQVANVRVTE